METLRSTIKILRGQGRTYVNKTDLISAILREVTPQPGTPEAVFSEARQCMVNYLREIPTPTSHRLHTAVIAERDVDGQERRIHVLYSPTDGGLYLDIDDLLKIVQAKNRIVLAVLNRCPTNTDFVENYRIGLDSLEIAIRRISNFTTRNNEV